MRVAVADQAAYETFYMTRLAELPGLARVNSQFTMKMVKRGGPDPAGTHAARNSRRPPLTV